MKIALVFEKNQLYHHGYYFGRAFQTLGHEVIYFDVNQIDAIPAGYSFYLRTDDGNYNFEWPRKLSPAFYWISDTHLKKPAQKMAKLSQAFDQCFFSHYTSSLRLFKKQLNQKYFWLPFACDPEIHKKESSAKLYDISFVGNDGGIPRKFILQVLRERYPKSFIGKASYEKLGFIYSSGKIGFNYSIHEDLNARIFEIMASGSFLLTNDIQDTKFHELFEDGKTLVLYKNLEELFELVEHYLKHDEARERIAKAGQEFVVSKHTYVHRAKEILKHVEQR